MSTTEIEILEEKGALARLNERLAERVPEGGRILYIADFNIPAAKSVQNVLARKYAVTPGKFGLKATREFAQSCPWSEDARMVVGAGAGAAADVSKYVAARHSLPLAFVALSPSSCGYLSPSAMLAVDDGFVEVFRTRPPQLLLYDSTLDSPDDARLAAGFGEVVSRLTAIFDWEAAAVLCGESFSAQLAAMAVGEIRTLLSGEINSERVAHAAINMGKIAAHAGNSRLFAGGDAGALHAYSLIKNKRGETLKLIGESEMLFSLITIRIYLAFLAQPDYPLVASADEMYRADFMTARLGISPMRSSERSGGAYAASELLPKLHALKEYRAELINRAITYEKTLAFAYRRFKRLYKDKGFSYNNYLSVRDLRAAVALAAESREKFTLFSLIKQTGMLEGLLRRA